MIRRTAKRLLPFVFISLVGCGIISPEPVSLDGDWTFEVVMPSVDGGGEAYTTIRNVLAEGTSVYFYEGGCDYLMELVDRDRLEGIVRCISYDGTVEGHRVRP
jgi:hypothetical protein